MLLKTIVNAQISSKGKSFLKVKEKTGRAAIINRMKKCVNGRVFTSGTLSYVCPAATKNILRRRKRLHSSVHLLRLCFHHQWFSPQSPKSPQKRVRNEIRLNGKAAARADGTEQGWNVSKVEEFCVWPSRLSHCTALISAALVTHAPKPKAQKRATSLLL